MFKKSPRPSASEEKRGRKSPTPRLEDALESPKKAKLESAFYKPMRSGTHVFTTPYVPGKALQEPDVMGTLRVVQTDTSGSCTEEAIHSLAVTLQEAVENEMSKLATGKGAYVVSFVLSTTATQLENSIVVTVTGCGTLVHR